MERREYFSRSKLSALDSSRVRTGNNSALKLWAMGSRAYPRRSSRTNKENLKLPKLIIFKNSTASFDISEEHVPGVDYIENASYLHDSTIFPGLRETIVEIRVV